MSKYLTPQTMPLITTDDVVRDLVRVRYSSGSMFVNLPMIYPDGSFVTVRIDACKNGFRVSDNGFTYREMDDIGVGRSFRRSANKLTDKFDVRIGDHIIFADTDLDQMNRAICDVAQCSWQLVHRYFDAVFEEEDVRLSDELNVRLIEIFGANNVEQDVTIIGASTTEWKISARVKINSKHAVFQAVSHSPISINTASTAFRDFSTLDNAPTMVSFVKNKSDLGTRLSLLAPSTVIEESQSDEIFRRAAA